MSTFEKDLEVLINRYSMENGSDTPDFILAMYLTACLDAWNASTKARDAWYRPTPTNPMPKAKP